MIVKCNKGHWYDSSVNKMCPHCLQESERLGIRLDDVEEDDRTISIMAADRSLGEELGAIIGDSVGTALPDFKEQAQGSDDDKTISFGFFGLTAIQPVTGWLVCMNGEERGKDYRLHAGRNFVGRSMSMDVMLVDDKTISRDKHCSIVYDPKGNGVYLSPEGGNTVYLDGQMVDSPAELKEGCRILIGETEFMFIPFCREGRSWESESY